MPKPANLSNMPRAAFLRLGDKLNAERKQLLDHEIASGRGHWRYSDAAEHAKGCSLLASVRDCRAFILNADALLAWNEEHDHRMRMHGKLTPWRPRRQ